MPCGFAKRSKGTKNTPPANDLGTHVQHFLEIGPGSHGQPIQVPIRKPEYTPKRMLHPPKQPRVPDADHDLGLWTRSLLARGEKKIEHLKQRAAVRQARLAERARRFEDGELGRSLTGLD